METVAREGAHMDSVVEELGQPPDPTTGGDKPVLKCLNCGKKISFGSYCTARCMDQHTIREKKDIGQTTLRSRAARRRALIRERGHRCEQCGRQKWLRKPITLFVFHRDADIENWKLDNLRLLCPNCRAYVRTWLRSDQR